MEQIQILRDFQKDSEWFHENIDKLRGEGLVGKFVAIKGCKPIASGKTMEEVISKTEKIGENPSFIFMEFVYPEGTVILL